MAQKVPAQQPQTLLDHTLRTAPLNVVYGTVAASIREYALVPVLTHFSLHPSPLSPSPGSPAPPPPSPHTANLLPTSLSALVAGTAFSYFQRPASAAGLHARAGLTLALGCSVLQGIVNEADVVRIKLLVWGEERARAKRAEAGLLGEPAAAEPSATAVTPDAAAGATAPPPSAYLTDLTHRSATTPSLAPSDPGRETFSERSDRLIGEGWSWLGRKASALSPVKKLDPEAYERKLEERLRGVEDEMDRARREREELETVGARLAEQQRLREAERR
ncbi:hypothetical protein Rhopal_004128-T1 [Rhodotorula paludigena]|uniref:Uncharacterized protein n=1 Tax=Rhodotorula paludigena TaxID=86838 RepID=A0AAV5GNL7_9BASI|nr:hypothetical protein Rhopal_004128-T1 [Rhodotorula paludigena]